MLYRGLEGGGTENQRWALHPTCPFPSQSTPGHLDCSQSDERGARCKRLQRLQVELGGRFRKWDWPRPQTMGGSPLTWLSLYLRAEAHTGHYAMIILFLRTPRAQPTKGGRGSPLAPYLIYSKSELWQGHAQGVPKSSGSQIASQQDSGWPNVCVCVDNCVCMEIYFLLIVMVNIFWILYSTF